MLKLLANWTSENWVKWLEETDYEDALPAVSTVSTTGWDNADYKKVRKNIRAALRLLAEKSEINQERMKRYFKSILDEIERERKDKAKNENGSD